jgi:hypothetical protein
LAGSDGEGARGCGGFRKYTVRIQVLTAASMMAVFSDVAPFSLLELNSAASSSEEYYNDSQLY